MNHLVTARLQLGLLKPETVRSDETIKPTDLSHDAQSDDHLAIQIQQGRQEALSVLFIPRENVGSIASTSTKHVRAAAQAAKIPGSRKQTHVFASGYRSSNEGYCIDS